ncbi:MAG: MgtC/SapB family protein [Weeksellaceae bacterium]
MELTVGLKLLISLVIGAAIGLEREIHERHEAPVDKNNQTPQERIAFLGIRTLSLTTALGTVAGLLYADYFSLFMLINIVYMVLLGVHYIFSCWITKDIGITSEVAAIFTYLIGVFIALEVFPIQLIIAMVVILMLILSVKDKLKSAVNDIHQQEVKALISYGLIALVVLPFLPNTSVTLGSIPYSEQLMTSWGVNFQQWANLELINPFTMWVIVVIITGVDFLGYVLERTVGHGRGLMLTSLVGGFVSSTATTQSLAVQSKEVRNINPLVAAAMFATFMSFFPVIILTAPINLEFLIRLLPTLLILLVSFAVAGYIFWKVLPQPTKETEVQKKKNGAIFSLKPALIFASLYIGIKLITKIALQLFGEGGFLASSAIAGFTGIDAVTINVADLAGDQISFFTAIMAFLIVNAVNLIAKTIYIYLQGEREFALKYGTTIGVIIVLSFAGLLFV